MLRNSFDPSVSQILTEERETRPRRRIIHARKLVLSNSTGHTEERSHSIGRTHTVSFFHLLSGQSLRYFQIGLIDLTPRASNPRTCWQDCWDPQQLECRDWPVQLD